MEDADGAVELSQTRGHFEMVDGELLVRYGSDEEEEQDKSDDLLSDIERFEQDWDSGEDEEVSDYVDE